MSPLLWQHPLHKFVPPPFEVDHMTGRDGPKMHTVIELFSTDTESFFMATLQPVICLVEKKENSPFFRIFLQCLLDYRHILKQFFVAVFNARECFQAINKIDKIGNLIFC